MVRNPLDTLASLKEANFVKTLPAEFDALVEVYLNYTNSGLNYVKSHKDSSIIIQYENLVSNPVSTIKEIMSFAGEKYEHQMLNSLNKKKKKSGIEDPKIMQTNSIHSNSLGRGKTDLSKSEIEYISEKCEKIFRKFNYELP